MKLLSIILVLAGYFSYGQIGNHVYLENFDDPGGNYSVTTGFNVIPPGNNPSILWGANNTLSTSGNNSFHVQGSEANTEIWFETNDFTTHDSEYVFLSFNHIAKIYLANISSVQISTNQGASWSHLSSNAYLGNSPLYAVNQYFNEGAYITASSDLWKSGITVAPDSSWWVNEYFNLSGLANDTSGSAPLGYPNVRLRFLATFNFPTVIGTSLYRSGWFIDDIEVIEANCDINYPTVDMGPDLYGSCGLIPVGSIGSSLTNNRITAKISAKSKFSGINSVEIFWNKNGVSGSAFMNINSAVAHEYNYDFNNVFNGDTISWWVVATDNDCGNSTRFPAVGSNTFYRIATPSSGKCGTIHCNNNNYLISSFPWVMDFENADWSSGSGSADGITNSHRGSMPVPTNGNWKVAPLLGTTNFLKYAWCVAPGSTGNNNSGPSSNHTTGGSKYLYTEGPLNNPTSTVVTNLVTPCMILSDNSNYSLEFYYHMYGADISKLSVDIDTGTNSPSWLMDHFVIAGQQQNSSNDPWKRALVSLSEFSGKIIKIRFRAENATLGNDCNLAIDDIAVFLPPTKDIEVVELLSPNPNRCAYGTNESIRVSVQNNGIDSIWTVPLAYRVDGGIIQRDTLFTAGLALGDTASHLFSATADLSPPNNRVLEIWSELINDSIAINDSINLTYANSFSISNFPFVERFESAVAKSVSNPTGSLNNPSLVLNAIDNSSINGAKWVVKSGAVRNLAGGPIAGANYSDQYLLFEDQGLSSSEAEFHLPCVDFTALSNPQLSFKYHNLSPTGIIEVLVKAKGSFTWNVVATLVSEQTLKNQSFSEKQFDLTSYAGQSVEVLIKAFEGVGTNSFMAIDDLQIFERAATDFSLVSVDNPGRAIAERGSTFNISVTINNASTNVTGVNATLGMRLIEQCASGTPQIITGSTFSFPFFANYKENKSLTTSMVLASALSPRVYEMAAWLNAPTDTEEYNDTVRRTLIVNPIIIIPYFNDFDACSPDFSEVSGVLDWENASPNKTIISNAYSGQNCWITNATENPINGAQEILLAPTFAGFDTIFEAELRFWHNHDFGNGYGVVQYRDQGSWHDLVNTISSNAYNWNTVYNSQYGGQTFSGPSNGWIFSSIRLSNLNQKLGSTRFRFLFYGDSLAEGWAIDNFEIYIPPQNSASPIDVASTGFPKLGANNLSVKVQNTGGKPLKDVNVTVNVNGVNIVSNQYHNFGLPLLNGKAAQISINSSINLNTGANTIEVITSDPNTRTDNFTLDDTLITSISILPTINTLPYCTDLESAQSFVGYSSSGGIDSVWKYGNLSGKALINSPYSGNRAWYTSDSVYGPLQDQYLFTPYFDVQVQKCYDFSFYHWFETEYNLDGGTVDYTADGGATWYTLGSISDTTWFNTPHIQSLDAVNPGWSGSSMGWKKAQKVVKFLKDGVVQFRFRFGSNSTIHQEGWAIDNVCFEEVPRACSFIGSNEYAITDNDLHLFPNPSRDKITLNYVGLNHGKAVVKIHDSKGTLVILRDTENLKNADIELDISSLPSGIYTLRLSFENHSEAVVKRFQKL